MYGLMAVSVFKNGFPRNTELDRNRPSNNRTKIVSVTVEIPCLLGDQFGLG
jgi:hypothetical protein